VTLGWPELTALDAYRITEIPRRPGQDETGASPGLPNDPGRTQRLAALIAAYHARAGDAGALALGWVRHRAGGPVQFLAAGPGLIGSQDDREVLLTLPGGARAEPLARGALATLMAELPSWRAIGGLRLEAERRTGQRPPPSLEECLLAVWRGAFGWLLVAEPVGSDEIGAMAGSSPGEAHRLRHDELRQGRSTGLWRVRLAAGGADADAAARVAGLVCASADLAELPYAVAPADGHARELAELMQDADAAPDYPWYASTELVAALARPPEREIPGVRLVLYPDFDVTQEPAAAGRETIAVGEVLDRGRRPAGPLLLPLDSVNRHVFVCGATGTGKSQTARALLESATRAGIPWLVVEPAKAEYRLMAARLAGTAEVVRIRPGDSDAIAAGLNPLEPAPDAEGRRFPLQTHADLVTALFTGSFRSAEPFGPVLSAALTPVYEDAGWDLALGEKITPDIATCLLTTLISDTGCFLYSNAKPHTLRLAAALVNVGANKDLITEQLYQTRTLSGQKVLGRTLDEAVLTDDGICYSIVSQALLEEFGATHEDLEDVVGALRAVDRCAVAALLKESPDGS